MSRATDGGETGRTKLMVSARTPDDARVALAAGVDLIDIKEPRNGPLGMADPGVMRDVAALVGDAAPLGASLGEWLDWSGGGDATELPRIPESARYLKVGLAGMVHAAPGWQDAYRSWRARVDEAHLDSRRPSWVAVLYADWRRCGGPSPEVVLELARSSGFAALLVDTFSKTRAPSAAGAEDLGGLFDHSNEVELRSIAKEAKSLGLDVVLSGSLTLAGARRAAELGASVVGLRTSVCRDGRRDGELDPEAIEHALDSIRGAAIR